MALFLCKIDILSIFHKINFLRILFQREVLNFRNIYEFSPFFYVFGILFRNFEKETDTLRILNVFVTWLHISSKNFLFSKSFFENIRNLKKNSDVSKKINEFIKYKKGIFGQFIYRTIFFSICNNFLALFLCKIDVVSIFHMTDFSQTFMPSGSIKFSKYLWIFSFFLGSSNIITKFWKRTESLRILDDFVTKSLI